jgi:hypothetical protein
MPQPAERLRVLVMDDEGELLMSAFGSPRPGWILIG